MSATSFNLPVINCIWIGREMGSVHAACLRSFMRHGHKVLLHCFDEVVDSPSGVDLFDANLLMKREEIVAHKKTGSLALASDIYRIRILANGMGIYADCDVFALAPFHDKEYIFGWDSSHAWSIEEIENDFTIDGLVNGAVLKIPVGSELLEEMLRATEDRHFIPPWLTPARIRKRRLRKKFGFPVPVTRQVWGVIGPIALTYFIKKLGLTRHVAAPDIFYFYRPGNHRLLLNDPELSLRDMLTPRSKAIHLCASGGFPDNIMPGSPLDEILRI
ncbi:hypothetical protein JQ506_07415 [Shinella sp. PSBB067]|uniref:hypothetical protein n=1 Tax=Shinella sp. PSBB067 TaxID=2715959 RepID=UPI00193BD23A|nr:hypothetical protein [Shinella sp. PSBB067]QRI64812.1 hypothetical protein JQ506_07415 [Shinella sp. PSBB067]